MSRYERVYLLLAAIFFASLVIANTLVFKFFDVNLPIIGTITMSAGVLPYPITFLATDLISELYGKQRADAVVATGLVVSVFMLIIITIAQALPVSHLQTSEIQVHFEAVFGQSMRAIFASMIAYLLAQFIDVRIFHYLKDRTRGQMLWLRNNASTMFSQLVDTIAVVSILFVGVWPMGQIIDVIVASYLFKLIVAATDTPVIYLCVYWLRDLSSNPDRDVA